MRKTNALWIATLVFITACESTTSTSELSEQKGPSPQGNWALRAFDLAGGQTVPVSDPDQYQLELGSDGRANVRADCNHCSGPYQTSGISIGFGLLACTLAACPPESLDGKYLQALGSASSFERAGEDLSIAYPDGVLRFGPK